MPEVKVTKVQNTIVYVNSHEADFTLTFEDGKLDAVEVKIGTAGRTFSNYSAPDFIEVLREVVRAADENNGGEPEDPNPVVAERWDPSSSNFGVIYHTTRRKDGSVICSCPGFRYRGECKHIARTLFMPARSE